MIFKPDLLSNNGSVKSQGSTVYIPQIVYRGSSPLKTLPAPQSSPSSKLKEHQIQVAYLYLYLPPKNNIALGK